MRAPIVAFLAGIGVIGSSAAALAQCSGEYEPTCSLLKAAPIVFLGTVESISDGTFHVRVEEPFAGVQGRTIDLIAIGPVEGETGYDGDSQRYLVFARTVEFEDKTAHAYVGGCGGQTCYPTPRIAFAPKPRANSRA